MVTVISKKIIYNSFFWLKTLINEKKRWRKCVKNNRTKRVFYGFDKIFNSNDKIAGGKVKVIYLNSIFPNCTKAPNILYLISSALPSGSVFMAKNAKECGAKVVINQNGVAYKAWHADGWEKANIPNRHVIRLADYVFYQSEFAKRSADAFLGKSKSSYEVLFNAVDTSSFVPSTKAGIISGSPDLLLTGSHHDSYRVTTALNVVSVLKENLPDIKLVLAGRLKWRKKEEDAELELRSLAQKLNIQNNISVLGPYSQKEATSLYQKANILLHTQSNDVCPTVVLEAMSCGLPIVYSENGGTPELVGEKAGVGVSSNSSFERIVPPDPVAMANAVLKVLENYSSFSRNARKRAVEKFSLKYWLNRHRTVFSELIG